MRIWLKRFLWLSAIFLLVWLAVVIYWQSTSRLPSESDLVLYLAVLPLALAGMGWGIYKLATRPSAGPIAAAGGSKDATGLAANEAAKYSAEQERGWTLNIVATSLQTSAGNSAAEVLAKLKAGDIGLELDSELKNADGFAVFSARIGGLDVADTQDAVADWQKTSAHADLQWSDSQYRALHLAKGTVNELAPMTGRHPDVLSYLKRKEEGRTEKEAAVLPLRLILMWPKEWPQGHQSAASSWVKSLVVQHEWPEHRIVMQEVKPEHANPIALLDYICVSAHRAQLPTVGILLACASAIDQEYVDALDSKNNLFGGKNTHGVRPGEAAAGLLFADVQQSQCFGDGPFSSLHRATWANRDKSADERGRVSAEMLSSLVGLALETSKLEPEKVRFISSDHDHKPSREAELAEMVVAKFPDLDCTKDAVKVAQACGSMHHVTTAAALCIAHQYVVDELGPVVCTSLHDPLLRAAVVLALATEKNGENATVNA
jgi:hypothetical protein